MSDEGHRSDANPGRNADPMSDMGSGQRHGCFAIFVKTPGLSPVKTRLATQIGRDRAEVFHVLAARAVASVCLQLQPHGFDCVYAVAEAAHPECAAIWHDLPLIEQPEGDLGPRMATVYADLLRRYRHVFLIGADVPQVDANRLQSMTQWLQQSSAPRFALAPSEDGGFWCVGGNADIEWSTWTDVIYSLATTRREFLAGLSRDGEVALFDFLRDVDEREDLLALSDSLRSLPHPTPEQTLLIQTVAEWLPLE